MNYIYNLVAFQKNHGLLKQTNKEVCTKLDP